jgi:Zn-finger nucleic acid-binding protein
MSSTDRTGAPRLCPLHRLPLLQSQRHGIEIDYCPRCYGAWFERGELDKVIEAYASLRKAAAVLPADEHQRPDHRRRRRRNTEMLDFLEDLFEFD